MRRLTLLSRSYCHLCEVMLAALSQTPGSQQFDVEVIDVDEFPAIESRWGQLVPVLLEGDVEICHYHLDTEKLAAHLTRIA